MADLSIYTQGGGELFREFFNAIASVMGGSGYSSLLKITVLMAGMWAINLSILKRNIMLPVKWFITYALLFYLCFLPKATIHIIDTTDSKPLTVDNIPLGFAVVAHYTSLIGAGLTQLIETGFHMPDDLHYNRTGLVMASRLVENANNFQITNPVFSQNLQEFMSQCVFYDLLLNKYTLNDLINTKDLWQFVSTKASPARSFLYNQTIVTCKQGVNQLNKDWQQAIQDAQSHYAKRLFPNHHKAKAALLSYLPLSYHYLINLSQSAYQITQQNLMANTIDPALMHFLSKAGAQKLLTDYALNKAQLHKRESYRTMGEMAAYWLPLMKNVFEAIMYGSFVIIFLLALFPFGPFVLKNYIQSLFWIQTWAPLFAIINFVVSYYAQIKASGIAPNAALTLSNMDSLSQISIDMASLAGYLSMSVPFLSGGLVRGMSAVFTQLAQYIGGITQAAAISSSNEAVTGNISLGNSQLHTLSGFNTNTNHFDTHARVMAGGMSYQLPGGSTITTTADGTTIMDNHGAISNLGTTLNLADAIRTTSSTQADKTYTASLQQAHAAATSYSAGIRYIDEWGDSKGHGESSGSSSTLNESANFTSAANQVHQLIDRFAKEHHVSHNYASRIMASVYGQGHVAGDLNLSAPGENLLTGKKTAGTSLSGLIGARGEWSWTWEKQDNNLYSAAEQFSKETHFSEAVDHARHAMRDSQFRNSEDYHSHLAESMTSSFEEAKSYREEAISNLHTSQSLHHLEGIAKEQAVSINSNYAQPFIEWLSHQAGPHGNGPMGMRGAECLLTHEPTLATNYAKQFAEQQVQSYLKHPELGDQQTITDAFSQNNQQLAGRSSVGQFQEQNEHLVRTVGQVNHDGHISHQAAQDVTQLLDVGKQQTQSTLNDMGLSASTLVSKVKKETG